MLKALADRTRILTRSLRILSIVVALTAPGALAAGAGPFSVSSASVKGRVLDAAPMPAAEGNPAAILVAARPDGGDARPRRFALFRLPGLEPSGEAPAPPDAVLFDVADVLPAPGPEVLVLCPDGVLALERREGALSGEWKRILKARTFFDAPHEGSLPRFTMTADLSGDGKADLLVPQTGGWLVAFGDSFGRVFSLSLEGRNSMVRMAHEVFQTSFVAQSFHMPVLRPGDFDGDGLVDLIGLNQKDFVVFAGAGDKGFQPRPTWQVRLASMETASEETEEDSFQGARLICDDVDANGLADLVVVRTLGKVGLFSSIRTRLELFLGRKGAFYPEVPDRILTVPGVGILPALLDLDGDRRKDLVVPALRTDVLSGIKTAVVKEVTISYYVFACGKDGLWETSPSFEDDAELPVSDLEKGQAVPGAAFDGDFDGDGRRDRLAFSEGVIRIHPGLKGPKLAFAEEPRWEIKAELSNDFKVEDMDGDGASDILIFHLDKVVVVLSSGR